MRFHRPNEGFFFFLGGGGGWGRVPNGLISWREQDEGNLEDVVRPLWVLSSENVVLEASEN